MVIRELGVPHICQEKISRLDRPFTDGDIRSAMFSLGNSKSPGPGGFKEAFFKLHWDKVGRSVCDAVKSFFNSGYLLKEWNHSILVVIPKKDIPEEVGHLRPISLCNTIYKCASKCMVTRMKPIIPSIISPSQHAFISGRFMSDNILVSHEIIDKINHRRKGSSYLATVKIDMSKAYDRVYWDFLLKILRAYGFPSHWIQLVHQCISTVSYKVLINGDTSEQFKPNCGIRQASEASCIQVKSIIGRFCAISGKQLNLQKSHFKVSPNTPSGIRQQFKLIFQMDLVPSLSTHLGVPIDLFFWANKGKSGMHWVNKYTVQLPKGMGGLGIRGMASLNKALLMKQAWRLFNNPQCILAGICGSRFPPPLQTGVPAQVVGKGFSWGMRGLCRASNLLLKGCIWKVASNWKVNHFIDPSGTSWNHARINASFKFEDALHIFTVKSAYAMLAQDDMSISYNRAPSEFYKNLWSLKIPPKWTLFIWKLLHNGIATKSNLQSRGIQMADDCDFCENGEENIQHIFRFCTIEQQVWRDGFLAIHSEFKETISFEDWNNRVFKSETTFVASVFALIKDGMDMQEVFISDIGNSLQFLHPPEVDQDIPPGFFRAILSTESIENSPGLIQVDGSWHKNNHNAGIGWFWENSLRTDDLLMGGASSASANAGKGNLSGYADTLDFGRYQDPR
ncbi:uncharacterized protein [Spinacia oleracea]|uniref:Reverse transcriptase domain-containing protein n=1 Tax=Spinacia oleracea TaxID=3562 RepID=A0ABM3R8R8_SPIOL|nr:uncharacterized protein LOC130467514 [Spinacia oleracea]